VDHDGCGNDQEKHILRYGLKPEREGCEKFIASEKP
jgi:hypothetical protein